MTAPKLDGLNTKWVWVKKLGGPINWVGQTLNWVGQCPADPLVSPPLVITI